MKPSISVKSVWIEDGKIKRITDPSNENIPSGTKIIDGNNKFLMPGISEMHAHIPVPQDGDDTNVRETLFLYLSNGITVIRGMLGNPYHLKLKKSVESGEILGPRIFTSSPSLNGNSIPDVETAISKVTTYKADGYDFLKLHPGLKLDVFNQIIETANEVDIGYAGHVSTQVGVSRAIEARYASIDHLDGYLEGLVTADVDPDGNGFFGYNFTELADENLIPPLAELTHSKSVWVVPTQSLFTRWFSPEDPAVMMQAKEISYMSPKVRYTWRTNKTSLINGDNYNKDTYHKFLHLRKQILKELNDAGVGLLLGSDAPQVMNVPGFSIQHEMQAMADAGINNAGIIQSGTSNPALFFGAEDIFGSIKVGCSADLLLLNRNPLKDIKNMQSIEGVMMRGQWLSRKDIDARLAKIAERHKD
jgi:imidazolonepropionase-like amidohydrolase